MSTFTVTGPLRYCRCGHGEHEHRDWLAECSVCECGKYQRDRKRRHRAEVQQ